MGLDNQTFLCLGQLNPAGGRAFDFIWLVARSRLWPFISCAALRAEYLSLTDPDSGGIDGAG